MEGFGNFTTAMDRASDFCSRWKSADDGTIYNYAEMMLMAAHLDQEFPLEERQWYMVFPDGEICMLHEDFDEIMPLWLPAGGEPVRSKFTGDEFYPDEPEEQVQQAPQQTGEFKYCMYCGEKLPADAVFCRKCGKRTVT